MRHDQINGDLVPWLQLRDVEDIRSYIDVRCLPLVISHSNGVVSIVYSENQIDARRLRTIDAV